MINEGIVQWSAFTSIQWSRFFIQVFIVNKFFRITSYQVNKEKLWFDSFTLFPWLCASLLFISLSENKIKIQVPLHCIEIYYDVVSLLNNLSIILESLKYIWKYFTAFWPTLPTFESPYRGVLSYLTPLVTSKLTIRSAKFLGKKSRFFISKEDPIC